MEPDTGEPTERWPANRRPPKWTPREPMDPPKPWPPPNGRHDHRHGPRQNDHRRHGTTAGIGDLRQRDDAGDKHRGHQIEQLTSFTTHSLLDGVLLVATDVLESGEAAAALVVFIAVIYRSAHQHLVRGTMVSPASGARSRASPRTRGPSPRRLDLDAQRRALRCAGGPDRLAPRRDSATPAAAKASTAKPVIDRRMAVPRSADAHGFPSWRRRQRIAL